MVLTAVSHVYSVKVWHYPVRAGKLKGKGFRATNEISSQAIEFLSFSITYLSHIGTNYTPTVI